MMTMMMMMMIMIVMVMMMIMMILMTLWWWCPPVHPTAIPLTALPKKLLLSLILSLIYNLSLITIYCFIYLFYWFYHWLKLFFFHLSVWLISSLIIIDYFSLIFSFLIELFTKHICDFCQFVWTKKWNAFVIVFYIVFDICICFTLPKLLVFDIWYLYLNFVFLLSCHSDFYLYFYLHLKFVFVLPCQRDLYKFLMEGLSWALQSADPLI